MPSPDTSLEKKIPPEAIALLEGLKPSWRLILKYLMFGFTQVDTAKKVEVSAGTVSRLWHNPEFKTIYNQIELLTLGRAMSNTSDLRNEIFPEKDATAAKQVLVSLINDTSSGPAVRASSAKYLIDQTVGKAKDTLEVTAGGSIDVKITDDSYNKEDDPFYKYNQELGKEDKDEVEEEEKALGELEDLDKRFLEDFSSDDTNDD